MRKECAAEEAVEGRLGSKRDEEEMRTANSKSKSEEASYDRQTELKAFDDSKAGVKGLADSNPSHIPKFFIQPQDAAAAAASTCKHTIPLIDFKGMGEEGAVREGVIREVRDACEKWGFFQIINHGVGERVVDELIEGIKRFHEQEVEVKSEFYSRDYGGSRRVLYNSNFDLFKAPAANWRDSLTCVLAPQPLDPHQLPQVCRDIIMEYSNKVTEVASAVLEVMSEALGLKPDFLKSIDCGEGLFFVGHYYPPCPQPELTMGTSDHSDSSFITILLQDTIGGLQVRLGNQWFDVNPIHGALVVNVGDMMQLITNDRFKSSNHRVVAKKVGPRVSVACFFRQHHPPENCCRLYGPIKELLVSEEENHPPLYRETTIQEYVSHYYAKGLNGISGLDHFKL